MMNKDITIISALLNYMTLNSMLLTLGLSPVTELICRTLMKRPSLERLVTFRQPTKRPPNATYHDSLSPF